MEDLEKFMNNINLIEKTPTKKLVETTEDGSPTEAEVITKNLLKNIGIRYEPFTLKEKDATIQEKTKQQDEKIREENQEIQVQKAEISPYEEKLIRDQEVFVNKSVQKDVRTQINKLELEEHLEQNTRLSEIKQEIRQQINYEKEKELLEFEREKLILQEEAEKEEHVEQLEEEKEEQIKILQEEENEKKAQIYLKEIEYKITARSFNKLYNKYKYTEEIFKETVEMRNFYFKHEFLQTFKQILQQHKIEYENQKEQLRKELKEKQYKQADDFNSFYVIREVFSLLKKEYEVNKEIAEMEKLKHEQMSKIDAFLEREINKENANPTDNIDNNEEQIKPDEEESSSVKANEKKPVENLKEMNKKEQGPEEEHTEIAEEKAEPTQSKEETVAELKESNANSEINEKIIKIETSQVKNSGIQEETNEQEEQPIPEEELFKAKPYLKEEEPEFIKEMKQREEEREEYKEEKLKLKSNNEKKKAEDEAKKMKELKEKLQWINQEFKTIHEEFMFKHVLRSMKNKQEQNASKENKIVSNKNYKQQQVTLNTLKLEAKETNEVTQKLELKLEPIFTKIFKKYMKQRVINLLKQNVNVSKEYTDEINNIANKYLKVKCFTEYKLKYEEKINEEIERANKMKSIIEKRTFFHMLRFNIQLNFEEKERDKNIQITVEEYEYYLEEENYLGTMSRELDDIFEHVYIENEPNIEIFYLVENKWNLSETVINEVKHEELKIDGVEDNTEVNMDEELVFKTPVLQNEKPELVNEPDSKQKKEFKK